MSKRQKFGKWMSALATLVLFLLSTSPGVSNNRILEPPLIPSANGLGPPAHSSEASNISTTAGRSRWVTGESRIPGSNSRKSIAILDGHCVQTHVLPAYRALQLAHTTIHDCVAVRNSPARAPPVPTIAI